MNIGFLGLGTMGVPIAKNLIQAFPQESYFFYARKENIKKEFIDLGASFENTISKLGESSEVIFVLLGTGKQCKECILGEQGLLNAMHRGIIILSSTIGYRDILEINEECKKCNVQLLDAPLSGGVEKARSGMLTFMISGEREAYMQIKPLLNAISQKIYFVDEQVGSAQKMKLLNQMLVGIHMTATAEVFALSEKMGLDLKLMFEILSHSAGTSQIFESRGNSIINRDFSTRSTLSIMQKDLALADELGNDYTQELVLTKLCRDLFRQAANRFEANEDSSAIIKLFE